MSRLSRLTGGELIAALEKALRAGLIPNLPVACGSQAELRHVGRLVAKRVQKRDKNWGKLRVYQEAHA
jgi:hypothetical protein